MRVLSELTEIQRILPEGFESKNFAFLYGDQGTGKSTFAIQEACRIGKELKKSVLYIRTEKGNFEDAIQNLAKLYDCPIIYKEIPMWTRKEIEVASDAIIYNIFEFFGEKIYMPRSDKGHMQFKLLPNPLKKEKRKNRETGEEYEVKVREVPNECEQIIRDKNVGVIIIDSFSEPLKSVFLAADNRPARADCLNAWSAVIRILFTRYDLFAFVVHHTQGVAPDSFQSSKTSMFAEASMGFKAEYSFLLNMYKGEKTQNIVRVTGVRIPSREEWRYCGYLKLQEGVGFRDCTKDEAKLVCSKSEFQDLYEKDLFPMGKLMTTGGPTIAKEGVHID